MLEMELWRNVRVISRQNSLLQQMDNIRCETVAQSRHIRRLLTAPMHHLEDNPSFWSTAGRSRLSRPSRHNYMGICCQQKLGLLPAMDTVQIWTLWHLVSLV